MTATRSASRAVESRWATLRMAQPRASAPVRNADRNAASLAPSIAAVASSSRRTRGSQRSARANVGRWPNGCGGSRDLALDEQRGFIFVGCSEGKASVIDAGSGALLSTLSAGSGVDVISYSPELRHLYVPGSDSATMAVLAVSVAGKLALLGTVGTTRGSHCVVADDRARAWICDQDRGQLLLYTDALPVP